MNNETLIKLSKNPHYKLNPQQQQQLDAISERSMIQFGKPELNNLPLRRRGRPKKYE